MDFAGNMLILFVHTIAKHTNKIINYCPIAIIMDRPFAFVGLTFPLC